jgi:hypothetical protein
MGSPVSGAVSPGAAKGQGKWNGFRWWAPRQRSPTPLASAAQGPSNEDGGGGHGSDGLGGERASAGCSSSSSGHGTRAGGQAGTQDARCVAACLSGRQ